VFLSIPEMLIDRREVPAAIGLLRGWLDKAQAMDNSLARRFIQAALSAGDPELALAGAQKAGVATLGTDAVSELADALDGADKRSDADTIRVAAGLEPKGPPADVRRPYSREGGRILPGYRIASLGQWRSDLWKRLGSENKVATQSQAISAHAVRSLRGFKALRRAKRLSSFRHHLGTGAKKPAGTFLDGLQVQPNP